MTSPLETSGDELREILESLAPRLAAYVDGLSQQPAWSPVDAEAIAARFREPVPDAPTPLQPLLETVLGDLFQQGFNTASPGYLAFIPGGGLPISAVANLVAGIINRYPTVWHACPAAAELEATVVRWICEIVGYPQASGGYLTTGGSPANWSAVVTARRCRLPEDFLKGTIYTSDQTHHSIAKAAMLAGFPERNVRTIPSDGQFRIRLDALREAIEDDRRNGWQPFLIVGNAGTVHTGAVDDFDALALLAGQEKLWLHADAAYGGFFVLTERGRETLAGLERCDSITLDPHKGLFLPFGTGALVVRRVADLETAHRIDADYLPPMQEDPERVDFCRISPELSRDFRGLRLWLPLKMCGLDAFREALEEKLTLAEWATEQLRTMPHVDVVADPQLSLVAFRLKPIGESDISTENARNREFLARINAGRRFLITGTMLAGRFTLRICVLSFRTHRDRVAECVEAIRNA